MNRIPASLGTALMVLFTGCASTPVKVAPVGPNPTGSENSTSNGRLEVFTALTGRAEGNDPTWFQHTDYVITDQQGKTLKHVENATGYYSSAPRPISLRPGHYVVKAEARDYQSVEVPVVIYPGRTTKVHLDDAWQPASNGHKAEFVSLPTGNLVGWNVAAQ